MEKGSTAEISLQDLLRSYSKEKATGCLRLKTSSDDVGFVYIKEGNPVHALYAKERGEKALALILSLPPSQFHFLPKQRTHELTLDGNLEELLDPGLREERFKLNSGTIQKWISLLTNELGPFASSMVDEVLSKENIGEGSVIRKSQLDTIIEAMCTDVPGSSRKVLKKSLAESVIN